MFNFDEIVAKIPAVEEYKRNNYYTNMYHHPLDTVYDYENEFIDVEDWKGRKGHMTVVDLARYIKMNYGNIYRYVNIVRQTNEMPIKFRNQLCKYFKRICFRFDDEVK